MSIQLAVDIGGTGMKAALVDIDSGELFSKRIKYSTPQPADSDNMGPVLRQLIDDFDWNGKPVGIGFPCIIKENICCTANNIDKSWIGKNIVTSFGEFIDNPCYLLNDADCAGLAEMKFGNGVGIDGTVIVLTLGTGIGSGMFKDGKLLANVELGSMIYKDGIAEEYASNKRREAEDMDWETYGAVLDEYLNYVNSIFTPDLIIIGGGISKKFKKYSQYLDPKLNVLAASLKNNAGIIGAAIFCHEQINI